MDTPIKLSCGTVVPAEVLDELAWASLDTFLNATDFIRRLDKEGKLLDELEEVLYGKGS